MKKTLSEALQLREKLSNNLDSIVKKMTCLGYVSAAGSLPAKYNSSEELLRMYENLLVDFEKQCVLYTNLTQAIFTANSTIQCTIGKYKMSLAAAIEFSSTIERKRTALSALSARLNVVQRVFSQKTQNNEEDIKLIIPARMAEYIQKQQDEIESLEFCRKAELKRCNSTYTIEVELDNNTANTGPHYSTTLDPATLELLMKH